jgi:hypothetical protein
MEHKILSIYDTLSQRRGLEIKLQSYSKVMAILKEISTKDR